MALVSVNSTTGTSSYMTGNDGPRSFKCKYTFFYYCISSLIRLSRKRSTSYTKVQQVFILSSFKRLCGKCLFC